MFIDRLAGICIDNVGSEFPIVPDDSVIRFIVIVIGKALVLFRSRFDLAHHVPGNHAVAEGFKKLKKIFEVNHLSIGYRFP